MSFSDRMVGRPSHFEGRMEQFRANRRRTRSDDVQVGAIVVDAI